MRWFLAVAALLLAVVLYGLRIPARIRLRHIPGPAWPLLFGNLLEFARLGDYRFSYKMSQLYGPIVKVYLLGGTVIVSSPQLCREVLLHSSARFGLTYLTKGKARKFDEAQILFLRGEKAITVRGAWQPMFHSSSLEGCIDLVNKAAERAANVLSDSVKHGNAIDISAILSSLSMQIIVSVAFGLDVSDPDRDLMEGHSKPYPTSHLLRDMITFFNTNFNGNSVYASLAAIFPFAERLCAIMANVLPDSIFAANLDCRSRLMPFIENLVRSHTASLAAQDPSIKAYRPAGAVGEHAKLDKHKGVAPGSFIDSLVRTKYRSTGASLTELEICSQAFIMMAAGLDTTSSALTYAIYLLALNPDKAAKVAAEAEQYHEDQSLSSLQEGFPYTEAALKEAIRLYPPGASAIRQTTRDMSLGGYKVPKDTRVMVSIYSLHHNEEYWPEAAAFLPERHLSGASAADGAATQAHAWLGFGAGARSCVGSRLAMLEAKLALVHLYRRFDFELKPGQVPLKLNNTFTLRPANGVWVRVHERVKSNAFNHSKEQ